MGGNMLGSSALALLVASSMSLPPSVECSPASGSVMLRIGLPAASPQPASSHAPSTTPHPHVAANQARIVLDSMLAPLSRKRAGSARARRRLRDALLLRLFVQQRGELGLELGELLGVIFGPD